MTDLPAPSFLFDLDGTLVDSVYQHVLAWHEALEACGIGLPVWRIHRRIGMSGGLFANALLREMGQPISAELIDNLRQGHAAAFARHGKSVVPLPGARELLAALTVQQVPWAIATSGRQQAGSWHSGPAPGGCDGPSHRRRIGRQRKKNVGRRTSRAGARRRRMRHG